MKTIHPLTLDAWLEASQPVEIVDIRPRSEFEKVHIEGAHSIPSAEISAEKLVCTREPLYLVSESGALAQLQACDLERQGLDNVVIVSGGMRRWRSDGLPVVWHHPLADRLEERCDRICAACRGKDQAGIAGLCAT